MMATSVKMSYRRFHPGDVNDWLEIHGSIIDAVPAVRLTLSVPIMHSSVSVSHLQLYRIVPDRRLVKSYRRKAFNFSFGG